MNSLRSHAYLLHLMTAFGKSIMIIGTLCLIMLFPAHSAGQQATLTDDAQTSAVAANQNFGANASVRVSGTNIRGFFKFKLTPNLPAGTTGSRVGKATLKLFVGSVTTPGTFDVFRVTGAWDEATVTGNTAPPLGTLESTIAVDDTLLGKWVTLDVTQLVKDWLDGALPNEGIALVANGGVGNVLFNSKENQTTSHEARLEVVLNHAATADRASEADHAINADRSTNSDNATTAGTANSLSPSAVIPGSQVTGDIAGRASSITGTVNGTQVSGAVAEATHAASADNANTVTNGVFTTGDQTIEGVKTFSSGVNTTSHYSIGGNRVLSVGPGGNIIAGVGAGQANTTGGENSFFGFNAGASNTTGGQNSYFGIRAGEANVTGINNSFFGWGAGGRTTSSDNSFFGSHSGVANTTGNNNSFFGFTAGLTNTIGSENSFFGNFSGTFNATGNSNSFFGSQSGALNTNGNHNSFFGIGAGVHNTEGSSNTFVGANAGTSNTTASNNTFIGANTNGVPGITNATALGANAQVSSSNTMVLGTSTVTVQVPGSLNVIGRITGNFNGGVSADALTGVVSPLNGGTGLSSSGTAGNFLRSDGSGWASGTLTAADIPAGNPNYIHNTSAQQTGDFNISGNGGIGGILNAGSINSGTSYSIGGRRVFSSDESNTVLGLFAGESNPTGYFNIFNTIVGRSAGRVNGGFDNSFFGNLAGESNLKGSQNSFFGGIAGRFNTEGEQNSFFGYAAGGKNLTGTANSFFGAGAGSESEASSWNSFFGVNAGAYSTGSENAFFGLFSGHESTTGSRNTFVGTFSGQFNFAGEGNTFIGYGAGRGSCFGNPGTCNNNTVIGAFAGAAANINNATAIGANASVAQSNSVVIGNNANVGIGTSAPQAKLHVEGGNILVASAGQGIILKSPSGATCRLLTIDEDGAMVLSPVACPSN